MFAILCVKTAKKHFIYSPWFVGLKSDRIMRTICNGFCCGADKNKIDLTEQLGNNITSYRGPGLEKPVMNYITPFIEMDYAPAFCAAGALYYFGGANVTIDKEKGVKLLKEGAQKNEWSCHEILSFIECGENKTEHLIEAAKLGSALAKIHLAKHYISQGNYKEATIELRHTATASSISWFRKHRSGLLFAQAVRNLTLNNEGESAYETFLALARKNILPAALWLTDGLLTGRTNVTTYKEVSSILLELNRHAPWKDESDNICGSDDPIDKKALMSVYKEMGSKLAESLLSYPDFCEK